MAGTTARVRVVTTVAELRAALDPVRRAGGRIGLVPTMGALHDGHRRLIASAAAESDAVVVSVFVNPAQFDEPADLAAYPRTLESDSAAASDAGATLLFAPTPDEVYPDGFATAVHVGGVSERWEGASRGAAHFDGVALVVAKLFGMVGADTAWFGRKDAQQLAVVRRLARDLNLATEVRAVDTVRDADGLALSSRNARLSPDERTRALALSRSLFAAREAVRSGERSAAALVARALDALADADVATEYWAVVDPITFAPVETPAAGSLAIVAARVGAVRLIDNLPLDG
ncbi:pantoate--beta-alanine ligase [Microbacterium sp. ARD31]|jgi:pantoate--beta-alanine ligase|uniref:pantoate--beta-alanine ligase n=1 Tax=Microbacterium sp. ARD31 TaxID=2962576 RepID=UPI0028829058|nr:pantoate--beta-alanine ligase [Microbacterium sp. ARD31]MDT0183124.1 pantoate--beta-alanine ligase [Microbacterium sp. ARD31]